MTHFFYPHTQISPMCCTGLRFYLQVLYEVNKIENVMKIIDYFNLKYLIVSLRVLCTQLYGSKLRFVKKNESLMPCTVGVISLSPLQFL